MMSLRQEAQSYVISFVVQWLGSYDFYFVEKECACSCVAFIVVCVQTSPYYIELVIHKNATYTHTNI